MHHKNLVDLWPNALQNSSFPQETKGRIYRTSNGQTPTPKMRKMVASNYASESILQDSAYQISRKSIPAPLLGAKKMELGRLSCAFLENISGEFTYYFSVPKGKRFIRYSDMLPATSSYFSIQIFFNPPMPLIPSSHALAYTYTLIRALQSKAVLFFQAKICPRPFSLPQSDTSLPLASPNHGLWILYPPTSTLPVPPLTSLPPTPLLPLIPPTSPLPPQFIPHSRAPRCTPTRYLPRLDPWRPQAESQA